MFYIFLDLFRSKWPVSYLDVNVCFSRCKLMAKADAL